MAHNSAKNSAKNRVRIYQSASSSEYLVVDRTDPKPRAVDANSDSGSSRLLTGARRTRGRYHLPLILKRLLNNGRSEPIAVAFYRWRDSED
jgi:hypothetical protein